MTKHAPRPDDATPAADAQAATRARLLAAAEGVFAEQGYRAATVREICDRADANVAAVNYHFGDKRQLYAEVMRGLGKQAIDHGHASEARDASLDPRLRLEAFIRGMLRSLADCGRDSFHGRLMARELFDPTDALDLIVREFIRPRFTMLCEVVRAIVGPGVDDGAVRRCAASIIGQCLFYRHSHAIIERLLPGHELTPERIEPLTAHILQFSHAALLQLRGRPTKARAGAPRRRAGGKTA